MILILWKHKVLGIGNIYDGKINDSMNISRIFIIKPIATTLLAVGIAFAGFIAFKFLPVASLPKMDFPTITVQASLPGASPDVMASTVAMPLERQIGKIAGVNELTSASSLGSTRIAIQFDITRDIDGAARDVQAAINAAQSQLPPELPSLPTYRKVNPSEAPIMIIALTSDVWSTGQLYDAASTILAQKISQVDGVGQVFAGGGSLPGVRIELNPTALNKYGIDLEDVRNSLSSQNVNQPKGFLEDSEKMSEISTNDQLFKAKEYMPLIIAFRNQSPVRISDVGEAVDSVEDLRNAGMSDGKPSIVLVVFKQPGSNIIETVDKVKAIFPELKASIPGGIDLTVTIDRTTTIRASLHDVEITLIVAFILVILVVYLFLGNIRASMVPTVAIPLSLLGTLGIIYLFDFSLDNLSLMALTIATGFVVDDAVVVLENISRHIEMGKKPFQAALQGSKEVGFTVLSMSMSLIAVFIPLLFMGGIVGRLFREFSITLSVAIFVSMVVSLTVTPMMCSNVLRKDSRHDHIKGKHSDLEGRYLKWIDRIKHRYEKSLDWALVHSGLMIILTLITIGITILLYIVIPKGFFPLQDTGRIVSQIQAQQDMSFQAIHEKFKEYIKIIKEDPAVEHVTGFVGANAPPGNAGAIYINLKPLSVRHIFVDKVINRLRKKLSDISGVNLYMQAAQDLVIGARQSNALYQYTLTADTLPVLNKFAPLVLKEMSKIPGITDLNSDQRDRGLQMYVTIDHDSAARYGINVQHIDNVLYDAFGQRQVSTLHTLMNQYHVVMEVAPRFWQNPSTLNQIYVSSNSGVSVPLSNVAKFDPSYTLLAVNHQSQFPSATLSFNLKSGTSLGEVVDNIEHTVERMRLPGNVMGSFSGTAQAFQESLKSQPILIIIALCAIYIVLGMLYESLIHPVTILSTLPSAGVGALLALMITNMDLTIIAFIGIILLIGIVKKNAIMMIDFALELERNEKLSSKEAILRAAVLRFRPIMMTTMAALLAAVPLAIGMGVGSELRRPLGISIIGGLILSQMLTLYTTPVIYLEFDRLSIMFRRKWRLWFRRKGRRDYGLQVS